MRDYLSERAGGNSLKCVAVVGSILTVADKQQRDVPCELGKFNHLANNVDFLVIAVLLCDCFQKLDCSARF